MEREMNNMTINNPLLQVYYKDSFMWCRLFGKQGFAVKDVVKHPLIFSERYGYTPYVKIGKWIIKYLKPRNDKR